MAKLLDGIDSPRDLAGLSVEELGQVAKEIRELILDTVSERGGHLSSNLGAAELAVALHHTFDFLEDRLLWDVGHQCYAHKILTGRKDQIHTVRQYGGLAGFPDPKESDYDPLLTSHAGTSISTGLGIVTGDDVMRRNRRVVCVIGDGAMSSGVAIEAVNNAGVLQKNLLIILNHNQMSISPNVGSLANYFDRIRSAPIYREAKKELASLLSLIPSIGKDLESTLSRVRDSVKHGLLPAGTIFGELGLKYYGPVDGHNMQALVNELALVRNLEGPILLHVVTRKGRGCDYTEQDPVAYHSPSAFDREKGEIATNGGPPSYSEVFADTMIELAEGDPRVVAVVAAMAQGTGLDRFADRFPDRLFDVGIAEQHAVAFAAGLAASGIKPVVAIYSTFLQRAYDQIFQEVCLQGLPVVFAVDRAGITGGDGATAQGNFDIAYLRTLPQITIAAPRNGSELKLMLRFAMAHPGPVAIRYPREDVPEEQPDEIPTPIEVGKGAVLREGTDLAILALGTMVGPSLEAAATLESEGLSTAVLNARFVKPVDLDLVADWLGKVRLMVTVEDHALDGGFGSAVLEAASDQGLDSSRIRRLGIPDRFIEHGGRGILIEKLGLHPAGIVHSIRRLWQT